MADFKWHLMADKTPEIGKGNYVIIGPKGGMYFATRFTGYDDVMWFADSRGCHHYPNEVKAWAKIPPFEEDE